MSDPDPDRAGDPIKQAWSDVADGFSRLGRKMKERYQGAQDDVPATPTTGVATVDAAGEPADRGADDAAADDATGRSMAALREALDRVVAAGRELGDRAADVAKDDDVKAQARQATTALNQALSATVDMIGDGVGSLFGRGRDEGAPTPTPTSTTTPAAGGEPAAPEVPGTPPASDDVRQ